MRAKQLQRHCDCEPRSRKQPLTTADRHCEEQSDVAILSNRLLRHYATASFLAMTPSKGCCAALLAMTEKTPRNDTRKTSTSLEGSYARNNHKKRPPLRMVSVMIKCGLLTDFPGTDLIAMPDFQDIDSVTEYIFRKLYFT